MEVFCRHLYESIKFQYYSMYYSSSYSNSLYIETENVLWRDTGCYQAASAATERRVAKWHFWRQRTSATDCGESLAVTCHLHSTVDAMTERAGEAVK